MANEEKCPLCNGKKDWEKYPLKQLCEGHSKRLMKILSGDTSKNISEKVNNEQEENGNEKIPKNKRIRR